MEVRLASDASNTFPEAHSDITCAALEFVEEKLGRKTVETVLRRLQSRVLET